MQQNLTGKKLWDLVNESVNQPKPEKLIDAISWNFDNATIMTFILGEVENNQI